MTWSYFKSCVAYSSRCAYFCKEIPHKSTFCAAHFIYVFKCKNTFCLTGHLNCTCIWITVNVITYLCVCIRLTAPPYGLCACSTALSLPSIWTWRRAMLSFVTTPRRRPPKPRNPCTCKTKGSNTSYFSEYFHGMLQNSFHLGLIVLAVHFLIFS